MQIEQVFAKKVCEEISLLKEGEDRFRVFTSFLFDDGDHLAIVLKKENEAWLYSDEGHTYLRLSYKNLMYDLKSGVCREFINSLLNKFQVEDRDGELIAKISGDEYGKALFGFCQALLKVSDIRF